MLILAQAKGSDPALLLFLIPLGVGIMLLASRSIANEGWAAFGRRYGPAARPRGRSFGSEFTRFNQSLIASYKNVVRVVPASEGLWFGLLLLGRAFHPPFLLPWTSVIRVELGSTWFTKSCRFHIQDEAGSIEVYVTGKIREALLAYRPDLVRQAEAVLARPR